VSSVYVNAQKAAERLDFDARYFREAIMPELRGVIRFKRGYRIPLASLIEWERMHTVTPRLQSVAGLSPDLNKNKINET
jgi:hypothetical protein